MSFRGLSVPHIQPRGKTVTSGFYVEEVLNETATSATRRRTENGPPTAVKLLPDMSQALFQQDEVPAHTAAKTQRWRQDNFPAFWAKGVGLGNSPDLSPIENFWAIVQDQADKMDRPTSEATLV